jgi:hypothetical protein
MPEHVVSRHTREHVLYLHLNDIADMMGMPEDAPITVRHVDQAPNKPDEVVRICVLEYVNSEGEET